MNDRTLTSNEDLIAEFQAAAWKWLLEKNNYTLESLRDARKALLSRMNAPETEEGHVAEIEQLTVERDFARRELDRACQEAREALSREIAARREQQEVVQWHEYANSVERVLRNARLPLPPRPSQKALEQRCPVKDDIRDLACCDVFTRESASEFCATCGYTNLDHLRKRSSQGKL